MNMQVGNISFFGGLDHLNLIAPSEVKAVSLAVDAAIARPVLAVTPIEGRAASLRVHVPDGSLIATRRDDQRELKREAMMLRKLWKAGAPVPRFIALSDDYLFEEDLGGRSLMAALSIAEGHRRLQLMEAAFAGLYNIKALARRASFRKRPQLFRSDPDWLERFVSSPLLLSEFLGVAPPPIDYDAVIRSLKMPASNFVKWGASPSNALICQGGGIIWFDWSTAGFGAGYEDVGFLISGENWPLEPTASLGLYRCFRSDWTPRAEADLCVFAALRTCHRLLSLGQEKQEDIKMYVIRRLVAHGLSFAGRSRLMHGAEPWFASLASERMWGEKFSMQPGMLGVGSDIHL